MTMSLTWTGHGPGEDQVKCQVGFGRVSQGRGLEDRS